MWRSVLVLLVMARLAHADPERRFSVGLAIPDEVYMVDHDTTFPLPTLYFGYAATPRVSLELGAGGLPLAHESHAAIAHLGVRVRLRDHALAPFVMARAGVYDDDPDEGERATFPFVLGGAGLEYVRDSGLGFWVDVGAGVIRYTRGPGPSTTSAASLGGSLGVAYHF
jgi:hypothetical protein